MEKDYTLSKRNKYCSVMLSAALWFTPLRTLLIKVGNIIYPGSGGYWSKISLVLFFLILVVPMLKNFKVTRDFGLWVAFVALSWTCSLFFHVEYLNNWISEAVRIFVRAMPFYLLIQNICNWKEAKRIFYNAAVITVMIMALYTLLGGYTNTLFEIGHQYNQFNGVITAGAATTCVIAWLDEKKMIYLFMSGLSIGMIMLFGARMPLACVVLGFVLFVFLRIQKEYKSGEFKISYKGFSISWIIIIVMLIGILVIAWLMTKEMDYIGNGQRIIYQIINGEFFKSSGRMQIYSVTLEGVLEYPLLGSGIISDRMVISEKYFGTIENFMGTYAHNIFLELWLQYGMILGSFLIGLILFVTIKLIFDNRMEYDKRMIVIYAIAMTYGMLLFSGPVYSNKDFWIMMGLGSIYFIKRKKLTPVKNIK